MDFKIDPYIFEILNEDYTSNDSKRVYNSVVEYIILVYERYNENFDIFEASIDDDIEKAFSHPTVIDAAKEIANQFLCFIEDGYDYKEFKNL